MAAPAQDGGRRVRAFGGYQPSFDGVRAVAMLFMMAYHGQLPGTKGAFLSRRFQGPL